MTNERSPRNARLAAGAPEKPDTGFWNLHLGANSIFISIFLLTLLIVAFRLDVLNWKYLQGLNENLSFFVAFFSVIFGLGFFSFWRLGERSSYTLHIAKAALLPNHANVIYNGKVYSFAVSRKARIKPAELPIFIRAISSIVIFICLSLVTLDNSGFELIREFPSKVISDESEFCQEDKELEAADAPMQGCELIIRAYKLGYAKDLGACEPKKLAPEKRSVCEKRRSDEPYLHYMSRLLMGSLEKKKAFFEQNRLKLIEDKFKLQMDNIKALRDYETYAINASPRASHHIWTNLPYPDNIVVQKYREYFSPNYCIEKFQNQTNTITLSDSDKREYGKLFEHVYGQLLFNPKSELTVAYCKEYKIHWNADIDACEKIAKSPNQVLEDDNVLPAVKLVLHRHEIINDILNLEEQIQKLEAAGHAPVDDPGKAKAKAIDVANGKKHKKKIVKNKIAKSKRQIRKPSEVVSFQCFMQRDAQADAKDMKLKVNHFRLEKTNFSATTEYFQLKDSKGKNQIAMYDELSKLLERRFHYSRLSSRSDFNVEKTESDFINDAKFLEQPDYLLSRLEILKNVDIFLGNEWVLERDDLLKVYPYHVHLKNYVTSFRTRYTESHGRL